MKRLRHRADGRESTWTPPGPARNAPAGIARLLRRSAERGVAAEVSGETWTASLVESRDGRLRILLWLDTDRLDWPGTAGASASLPRPHILGNVTRGARRTPPLLETQRSRTCDPQRLAYGYTLLRSIAWIWAASGPGS